MQHKKTNPASRAAGRVGTRINGLVALDASNNTAASAHPQASIIIARKYRLEPVIARLVCHLAGIGLEART